MAYQISTAPAFLEPFGEKLADLTQAELQQPIDISSIAPQVAGVSPLIQAAQQRTATQAGLGSLSFDPTTGAVSGVGTGTGIAAYEPYLQQAQSLTAPSAYQQFMSPYQTEVLDATQQLLNEQRAAGRGAIGQQAVQAGAFGGSRQGVAEAEYERQRDLYDAATLAGLRQQGLQQAQNLQQQALTNQLNLATQQAGFESGITSALGATGAGAQTYSQSLLDAARQGNVLGMEYPLQRLGTATNIFGGIASGTPQQPGAPITTSPAVTAAQTFAGIYGALKPQQQTNNTQQILKAIGIG